MIQKELVNKLKRKDKQAQKLIYDEYGSLFFGICRRYAANYADAKDILQEGFIKIFYNINKYSEKGSFEGWMRRIIVNNAINYYRKSKKYQYFDTTNDIQEIKTEETLYDENDFTYEELISLINKLPTGYRTIFNLYIIEGYTHKEIAEILNISESTSKSQLHRAKATLQEKITQIKKQRDEI